MLKHHQYPFVPRLKEAFANFWVSVDSQHEAESETRKVLTLEGWDISSLEMNHLDPRKGGGDGAEARGKYDLIREMPSEEPYVIHHVYLKH